MQPDELKALRKGAGLSQDDFARIIGMSRVSIGMMERGQAAIERRTELSARYVNLCMNSSTIMAMAEKARRATRGKARLDADDLEQIAEWLDQSASLPRDWE